IMAKCRIGHLSEAGILEEMGVDMIDESEVLSPADETRHIWKWNYTTPFVNGAKNLGEALRRIEEGASMIRTKGEPGTGDVSHAVTHIRMVNNEIKKIKGIYDNNDDKELIKISRELQSSYEIVRETRKLGRLTVVNFAAGVISILTDDVMLMNHGSDGIYV